MVAAAVVVAVEKDLAPTGYDINDNDNSNNNHIIIIMTTTTTAAACMELTTVGCATIPSMRALMDAAEVASHHLEGVTVYNPLVGNWKSIFERFTRVRAHMWPLIRMDGTLGAALSVEDQAKLRQCLEDDVGAEAEALRAMADGPKRLRGKVVAPELGECARDIEERIEDGEAALLGTQKQLEELKKREEALEEELEELEKARRVVARLKDEKEHLVARQAVAGGGPAKRARRGC